MEQFSIIDEALAFVRLHRGVHKILDVYRRNDRLFVRHGSGFIRICSKLPEGGYTTTHPDVKVLELEVKGLMFKDISGPRLEPIHQKSELDLA